MAKKSGNKNGHVENKPTETAALPVVEEAVQAKTEHVPESSKAQAAPAAEAPKAAPKAKFISPPKDDLLAKLIAKDPSNMLAHVLALTEALGSPNFDVWANVEFQKALVNGLPLRDILIVAFAELAEDSVRDEKAKARLAKAAERALLHPEKAKARDERLPPVGSTISRTTRKGVVSALLNADNTFTRVETGKVYTSLSGLVTDHLEGQSVNGMAWFGLTSKISFSPPTAPSAPTETQAQVQAQA